MHIMHCYCIAPHAPVSPLLSRDYRPCTVRNTVSLNLPKIFRTPSLVSAFSTRYGLRPITALRPTNFGMSCFTSLPLQTLDGLVGNTYDGHRMVALAQHQGKVSQFKEALWRM